jgi:nucleotide-binding universal stress UspA family protein
VPPDNQDLFRAGELSIRSILLATDFSPASHASGLYARALSTEFRVPMTVVHAFLPSQSAQEAEETTGRPSAERLGLKAQLDRTAAALSPPHAPAAALLLQGVPSEELQRISEEQAGVLLVLGTHGGSVIGRHFLGSTAESVLSAVSCPTLTVGPHVTDPRQEQLFQHVLYATDCSITGARAAALACAVAFRFGGELRVIGVIDDKEGPAADLLARFDFHMRKELSQTMHDPCTHFAESSKLATATHAKDVILRELAGGENDLLVLGIRQKAFLGFAERNSTAFQIIASASRPVLTITDKALSSR